MQEAPLWTGRRATALRKPGLGSSERRVTQQEHPEDKYIMRGQREEWKHTNTLSALRRQHTAIK
eukprot:115306-Pleurochrysis_carterae.AAC.1